MLSISPEALTAALNVEVAPIEQIQTSFIGAFSCELWRLDVRYGDRAGPTPLVLKRPKQEPGRDPLTLERKFYQHFASRISAVPKYFGYLAEEDGVLLEFVHGLEHFDWMSGPGETHAEDSLVALAELHNTHTVGMADDNDNYDDVGIPRFDAQVRADAFDQGWARVRDLLVGYYPQFAPVGDALVGRLSQALRPLATPECLLHGDAHGENIPVRPGGGVCLLDWQDPALGNPGLDVADYLVMSYPVAVRRTVAQRMVERHAELLDIEFDAWTSYRIGTLQRVARVTASAGQFPDWANSSLPWVFERCAAAAIDANVLELI